MKLDKKNIMLENGEYARLVIFDRDDQWVQTFESPKVPQGEQLRIPRPLWRLRP